MLARGRRPPGEPPWLGSLSRSRFGRDPTPSSGSLSCHWVSHLGRCLQELEQVRCRRRVPELSEERYHLPAVVGRVIGDVLHEMRQGELPRLTFGKLERHVRLQALVGKALEEDLQVLLRERPTRFQHRHVSEPRLLPLGFPAHDLFGWCALPQLKPEALAAEDVDQFLGQSQSSPSSPV